MTGWGRFVVVAAAVVLPGRTGPPDRIRDLDTIFDANELSMFVTNQGSWAFDIAGGEPGLEWPRGSGATAARAAGLWVGADVRGQVRVTVAEYEQEFTAGPIGPDGEAVDPLETDPAHRVYKIRAGDGPSNPDWAGWPVGLGAPVNPDGTPRVTGAQTLWCVYNDAYLWKHVVPAGSSIPLKLEVRQTAFGFDRGGALGNTVFLDFGIESRWGDVLDDVYLAFWLDPELGTATDDLVGCDTTLALGYCYNSTDYDPFYGAHMPAVGVKLLLGPVANGDTLGMTGFVPFENGTDPATPLESYKCMQGLNRIGGPQLCGGSPTRFPLSGDPVAGTGCLDTTPSDRRLMLAAGPITLNPGDVQHVILAVIVAGKLGEGDRLANVMLLRSYARAAQDAFDRGFEDLNDFPVADPGGPYTGGAGELVQLDGTGSLDPDGVIVSYAWDFGDGSPAASGPRPAHIFARGGTFRITLTVTDDRGAQGSYQAVARISQVGGVDDFTDVTPAGIASVDYLNLNAAHRRALTGVDWAGRWFSGGVDTGCRFFGSTFTDSAEDTAEFCPGAVVDPERFASVDLQFGDPGAGKAYLYRRRELADGSQPPLGRQYAYGGFIDVPFTARDSVGNRQLAVLVTERQVVDLNNVPMPPDQQPPSADGAWGPTADGTGGREYVDVLDAPYSDVPDPELERDGVFFSGDIPAMYSFWLRLRAENDVIDPGDRLAVRWLPVGSPGAAADVAWVDFDHDRDLDLHVAGASGVDRLFRNEGGGTFSDATRGPIGDPGPATGAGWADHDNDGDLDVYVAHAAGGNRLLRNDGGGAFAGVTGGPLGGAGASAAVTWADTDRDGDLDLYLANTDGPNRLLRNDGGGVFADATNGPLGGTPGAGRSAAWADFDGDGDPDVYLANAGPDRLLRNDGGGVFAEVSGPYGDAATGADVDWGDHDGDGDLDLYVVNADGPNRLLRNDGGETFADATSGPLGDPGAGRAGSFGDFDNDGDLDLYVVNADGPNRVFQNAGNGVFADVDVEPIVDPGIGMDAAWGDYDGDGDLDLYLANESEARLFRNDIAFTHWLEVDLVGRGSNAFGVGARLRVVAGGRSQIREVSASSGNSLTAEFGLGEATQADTLEVRWPSGLVQVLDGVAGDQRIEVLEPPVAVTLSSFEAASEVGRVVLTWQARVAAGYLGFHVWRSGDEGARWERLDSEFVCQGGRCRFVDAGVTAGRTYLYRLEALERGGGSELFGPVRGTPLARPLVLALRQNVPNPFASATAIGFELPAAGEVRLAVYDVAGRCVRRLVDGRREAGAYEVLWDGRTDGGRVAGAGVYVCRLEVGGSRLTRKLLVLP